MERPTKHPAALQVLALCEHHYEGPAALKRRFRTDLNAFIASRPAGSLDEPREIKRAAAYAKYWLGEYAALNQLRKYRAMKNRYYAEPEPENK